MASVGVWWRKCAVGITLALSAALPATAKCDLTRVDLRWDAGQVQFTTQVAQTDAERAQGLMFRETLAPFDSMFFVYDAPRSVSFWMKNTFIPLDMVFLDAAGVVSHIHANATPQSLESIFGGDAVQYVLEINGGLAQTLGLGVGAELRHPLVNQELAAWPCQN